jgi:proteasome accessory factor B
MKTSRVSRIVQILTVLQSGRQYAVKDLTRLLGISRRSVFRDLKELQSIGVPYSYDARKGGYGIDPSFFLPPVDLNLQEALSLCLFIHKAADHLPMPFKSSAVIAALKIENNLPAGIRKYCHTVLRNVSIQQDQYSPMNHLDRIFWQLQEAIVKKQKISIRYSSLYEQQQIATELSPYHLMYNKRAWYVVGHSGLHNSVRTFKLGRIKELSVLVNRFIDGDNFDVNEYIGRAWCMIPEGRIYNIRLRFLPKVAQNVAEVQWHSTQKVFPNDDGSVTVELRVDGLGEITWWILGYGDQVQVLAPAVLRRRVMKTAENMIGLNQQLF